MQKKSQRGKTSVWDQWSLMGASGNVLWFVIIERLIMDFPLKPSLREIALRHVKAHKGIELNDD